MSFLLATPLRVLSKLSPFKRAEPAHLGGSNNPQKRAKPNKPVKGHGKRDRGNGSSQDKPERKRKQDFEAPPTPPLTSTTSPNSSPVPLHVAKKSKITHEAREELEDEEAGGLSQFDDTLESTEIDIQIAHAGQYATPSTHVLDLERAQREAATEQLAADGWKEADIQVFRKIAMRGFEPLLPAHWRYDFRVLPDALFASGDAEPYVRALGKRNASTAEFRGARALERLFEVGPRVRDAVLVKKRPDSIIRRGFQEYVDWAVEDAGLKRKTGILPLLVIYAAPNNIKADMLQARSVQKLRKLDEQWHDSVQEADQLPPLYGVIVSDTVWAIVAYEHDGTGMHEANDPANYLRTIALFDYGNRDHDVWNGFALAILALHCRNTLLEFVEGGAVSDYDGSLREESPDPDL